MAFLRRSARVRCTACTTALLAPVNYAFQAYSNDIALKINHAFNYWLEVPQNKLDEIQDLIKILYNATFMLDDTADSGALRFNVPAAYHLYEMAITITSACIAINMVYERTHTLNHPEMNYNEYCSFCLCNGIHLIIITIRDCVYFSMRWIDYREARVLRSTGEIIIFANLKQSIGRWLMKDTVDESFADDISAGTFTFLIIHAIRNHPEDQQIIHILRRRTKDLRMKQYCIKLLEQFGSIDYTRATLEKMDKQAREVIQHLRGNCTLCNETILKTRQTACRLY
ncbi:terpene synthase-like [Hylaeus anthracinus]|uniref:terpene synthase-like n=1 Tax=Hylaeus anthracinus TaxID=313031 RepID=UPI0023B8FB19|nr:terpene synthase-like [Hylaeus anthracinus]